MTSHLWDIVFWMKQGQFNLDAHVEWVIHAMQCAAHYKAYKKEWDPAYVLGNLFKERKKFEWLP